MVRIKEAILVEGRYDKNTLSQIVDAPIFETSGFGIFKNKEQMALLRYVAERRGLIVFTDADGAGFVIRNHVKSAIPSQFLKHAYTPDIPGKERRKSAPGKEGKLGVEGMTPEVILEALRRAGATFEEETQKKMGNITQLEPQHGDVQLLQAAQVGHSSVQAGDQVAVCRGAGSEGVCPVQLILLGMAVFGGKVAARVPADGHDAAPGMPVRRTAHHTQEVVVDKVQPADGRHAACAGQEIVDLMLAGAAPGGFHLPGEAFLSLQGADVFVEPHRCGNGVLVGQAAHGESLISAILPCSGDF